MLIKGMKLISNGTKTSAAGTDSFSAAIKIASVE